MEKSSMHIVKIQLDFRNLRHLRKNIIRGEIIRIAKKYYRSEDDFFVFFDPIQNAMILSVANVLNSDAIDRMLAEIENIGFTVRRNCASLNFFSVC